MTFREKNYSNDTKHARLFIFCDPQFFEAKLNQKCGNFYLTFVVEMIKIKVFWGHYTYITP